MQFFKNNFCPHYIWTTNFVHLGKYFSTELGSWNKNATLSRASSSICIQMRIGGSTNEGMIMQQIQFFMHNLKTT
jgi:hypothetical protein